MFISIIIPTKNRASVLGKAIGSLINQTVNKDGYEILIMDQSTNDDTKDLVNKINKEKDIDIKYFYNKVPGLHSSRNIGARLVKGAILFFTDDDIIANKDYLKVILDSFRDDKDIAIMAGKIIPSYEGDVPGWIESFWQDYQGGKYIWQISLLDLGEKTIEISPDLVFGCNYIVRRDLFIKYKGTNPDIFSRNLMKYSGSSEIALSYKIRDAGLKIIYEPKLTMQHIVTEERLTKKYFYERNYIEGIKKSYFDIRKTKKKLPLKQILRDFYLLFKSTIIIIFKFGSLVHRIKYISYLYSFKGRIKHKWWVLKDKRLFEYILRDNYFDEGKEFI